MVKRHFDPRSRIARLQGRPKRDRYRGRNKLPPDPFKEPPVEEVTPASIRAKMVKFLDDDTQGLLILAGRPDFNVVECECSGTHFKVNVHRQPDDGPGNFHGEVVVDCVQCSRRKLVLRCLSLRRRSMRRSKDAAETRRHENLTCACGSAEFVLGLCDLFDDEGMFDDSRLVGYCLGCGVVRMVAHTD